MGAINIFLFINVNHKEFLLDVRGNLYVLLTLNVKPKEREKDRKINQIHTSLFKYAVEPNICKQYWNAVNGNFFSLSIILCLANV